MAVSPAKGTNTGERQTLKVMFSTANLAPGTYDEDVVIGISGTDGQFGGVAAGSPKYINVSLVVEPRSVMVCSHSEINEDIIRGGEAPTRYFTVENSSVQPKGDMVFAIEPTNESAYNWFTVGSTGGLVQASTATISVSYDTSTLPPGKYDGSIKISAIDVKTGELAVNSPQFMNLSLIVRPTPGGDFAGTGKSSMVVYHEPTGQWYIRSLEGEVLAWGVEFGGPGFTPVPGEYMGEGRMDYGVYYEAEGMWYVRTFDDSRLTLAANWGGPGFIPVGGDYNGDGVRDLGVYFEAAGLWYALASTGEIIAWAEPFGGPGFMPVQADYDGDGKTDIGVYQPTTGLWFLKQLNGEILAWNEQWGGPSHIPVVGDFSGNGQADIGVYNEGTGQWYIRTIDGELLAWDLKWGNYGMVPVIGDFDGDHRDDLAVYCTLTGKWYIINLSGSVVGWDIMWGGPGFSPVGSMK